MSSIAGRVHGSVRPTVVLSWRCAVVEIEVCSSRIGLLLYSNRATVRVPEIICTGTLASTWYHFGRKRKDRSGFLLSIQVAK